MGRCFDPADYSAVTAYDLIEAAAMGRIGLDHRLLHALLDDPRKSLPGILRFAVEERVNDRVVLEEDLVSIFRHIRTPEALPYCIELVRRAPDEISDDLVEAFALFPEASSTLLLELYEQLGAQQGGEVAFLLASLRVRDARILKALTDRLKLDPGEAAFCVGLYGDRSARPDLERLHAETQGDDAHARWVRESIEKALTDLDSPEPHIEHPDFDIWDLYPETALPQFAILTETERLELLAASSAEYRAAAAESFFDEDLSAVARDRLLEVARQDEVPAVRARAWEALGNALDDSRIKDALSRLLADESALLEERCAATVALAFGTDDPEFRRWVLAFYEIPEARAKALEAMQRSGDRRFARFFPAHLDDPDQDVRRRAIWGVGSFGIQTEAAKLRALFEDEEFREDALFAYAMSVPPQITRGRARALLRKVEDEAGGLSRTEAEVVQWAIDERLARQGLDPFFSQGVSQEPAQPAEVAAQAKVGRNDPCPCGSGKKYKKCCGA